MFSPSSSGILAPRQDVTERRLPLTSAPTLPRDQQIGRRVASVRDGYAPGCTCVGMMAIKPSPVPRARSGIASLVSLAVGASTGGIALAAPA